MRDTLFTNRCAIKFYVNFINTVFVYCGFFSLQCGLKCVPNFFYLILNLILREPLALFECPPPIKSWEIS
jgi:hypothetical protein